MDKKTARLLIDSQMCLFNMVTSNHAYPHSDCESVEANMRACITCQSLTFCRNRDHFLFDFKQLAASVGGV